MGIFIFISGVQYLDLCWEKKVVRGKRKEKVFKRKKLNKKKQYISCESKIKTAVEEHVYIYIYIYSIYYLSNVLQF